MTLLAILLCGAGHIYVGLVRRGLILLAIVSLFQYMLEAMDCHNPVPGACAA